MHLIPFVILLVVVGGTVPDSQGAAGTETDQYRRVELLDPSNGSFKTVLDVSATTAGAREHVVRLGEGAETRGAIVRDLTSGAVLSFEPAASERPGAGAIRIRLARPVPPNGQARLRIEFTSRHAATFAGRDGVVVFRQAMDVPRGTVVLPPGYALVACNVASQVLAEADGRTLVSYMHQAPGVATMEVTARAGAAQGTAAVPKPLTNARSWEPASQRSTERARLTERATQDRDIVYFLQEPSTNAFSLYHDYTESRPGTDKYLNVVRAGARVSNPSAYILDTGEVLRHETLRGDAITAARLEGVGAVTAETEVVVIHFPAVKEGQAVRLRISETYTTPESYRLDGVDLVFERSLGRARNSVVLPPGWYLTATSIPAVIRETADGLTRLDFVNGRPEAIDVLIKGRKRPQTP